MRVTLKTPLVLVDDADLVRTSRENPGYRFEREDDGAILVSPTQTSGGAKSLEAAAQLYVYARRAGGKAFDSSTGFAIGPDRRVYSPDASWVSAERIASLSADDEAGFWPLSPDVAIEVRSRSDDFDGVVAKIERYVERGSRYAVAIDPQTGRVVERGRPPDGLELDVVAIVEA